MSDELNQTSKKLATAREILDSLVPTVTGENPTKIEGIYRKKFSRDSIEAQAKYEHLQGLKDHYKQKGHWSTFLIILMGAMVVFQCVLLGMVGAGQWDFSEYEWLLPALLAQNLAQIVGLAIFVVKSLFKN
jgi:hypothetical protein